MPCPAFPRDRRRTLNSSSSPVFLLPMAFSPLFLSRAERSRAMAERNLPQSVASEGRTPQGFISVQMPSVLARLSPGPPSTAELRSRAQHLQHPSPLPRLVWLWETFPKLSTFVPGCPPPGTGSGHCKPPSKGTQQAAPCPHVASPAHTARESPCLQSAVPFPRR